MLSDQTPTVLEENEHFVVVDKPSGLMVHTDGRTEEPTLVDWIREHFPEIEEVGETQTLQSGETVQRPGIVHRLDRDTSGVMIIAKTQEMYEHLKRQFQEHKVEKEYRALVHGVVKDDEVTIDRAIGRSASDPRKRSAQRGATGKLREAVTDLQVVERFDNVTYVAAFPRTGRTHQIRVHLKAIHHPILCDPLYSFKDTPCPTEIGRLALHAYKISFSDLKGNTETVASGAPERFEKFLYTLRVE